MRINNLGLRRETGEPKRNHWKRYLFAGAIALMAIGVTKAHHCDSCNTDRRKSSVASEIRSAPPGSAGKATKERFAAWVCIRKKALSHQPILPPDPLEAMIGHDLPYGSLNCEITVWPRENIPDCEGNWFVEGMCEAGGTILVAPYELKFYSKTADELFQDACPEGETCEPALLKELDRITTTKDPRKLIHFINTINKLGIEWPENGDLGGILSAHYADLIEAYRNGLRAEADERCVARLFYASSLISHAQAALADIITDSPASLGPILSALHEDSRPGFMLRFASSVLFSEVAYGGWLSQSYSFTSAPVPAPMTRGAAIQAAFESLPEVSKQFFLGIFDGPFSGVIPSEVLRDLAAKGDHRLREAAAALLKKFQDAENEGISASD